MNHNILNLGIFDRTIADIGPSLCRFIEYVN